MSLFDRLKAFTYNRGAVLPGGTTTIPADNTTDAEDGLSDATRRALRNARNNPTVFSVVDWLANQISTAPMLLRRKLPNGDTEVVEMHELLDLLISPSDFLSGRELLSVSSWDMLIKGQTFWRKDRVRAGLLSSLTFLPAGEVEVIGPRDRDPLITEYKWTVAGSAVPIIYQVDEIVHIRLTPDPLDPKNGLPPLVALARALLLNNKSNDYTSIFLSEIGSAGGFLMPPAEAGVLSEEVAKATRQYIQNEFRGSKRGTLGVLRATMEFIRTAVDPTTAGTRHVYDEVTELICSVFGVHPAILGLGAGNAQSRVGAALTELERAAWNNRVIPLQDTITEQIGRQVLPEFVPEAEVRQWTLGWDRSNVYSLQPDMLREAQRMSVLVNSGIATRYMALDGLNLPADDSDKVLVIRGGTTFVRPEDALAEQERRQQAAQQIAESQQPPSDTDDEDGNGDGQAASQSLVTKTILHLAKTKAVFSDQQRRVLIALARDAEILFDQFSTDLEAAFEDLGERAVEAFWAMEGGEFVLSTRRVVQQKQGPEITQEVNQIMRSLNISSWEQGQLIPAWDGHTLRTLNTTVGTINSTLGLEVNIPDPVSRDILGKGGQRRGLVDFTGQTRTSLFQALEEGRANGEGPFQLARRIRDQVPAGPFPHAGSGYRAQLIARTETAYAQNTSSLEVYKQAGAVFSGVIISDGDYDPACAALNGVTVTFAEFDMIGPIEHPQCVRAIAPALAPEGEG